MQQKGLATKPRMLQIPPETKACNAAEDGINGMTMSPPHTTTHSLVVRPTTHIMARLTLPVGTGLCTPQGSEQQLEHILESHLMLLMDPFGNCQNTKPVMVQVRPTIQNIMKTEPLKVITVEVTSV